MIKALVLDLDGTLYPKRIELKASRSSKKRVYHYLRSNSLMKIISKTDLHAAEDKMATGSVSMAIRELCKKYPISLHGLEYYAHNQDPAKFGMKRDRVLASLLKDLSKEYKIAIFTNSRRVWAQKAVRVLGISRIIKKKYLVYAERVDNKLKPEPAAFRLMFKDTGLKAREILFLDDKERNVSAAKKLGMKAMMVDMTGRRRRDSIHAVLRRIKYGLDSKNDD